ncbi:hypothetical protein [Floridanema evergladense]|uniref:ParB/Sulfiredoxin domain-containing protein n=1 Tax=Floridaenema evergladense BLCC-F167 TaxID=3153639 RepID=A0ABV4WI01_9CYAN
MISLSLVDVKNITSSVPRSTFNESDLEQFAQIILDSGELIKPLILKVIGSESYSIIDGHLEYYAAVRAREKDTRKGEMVNAFVVSGESEDIVKKQVELIRSLESGDKFEKHKDYPSDLELRITNIELRIEKQINEFREEQAEQRRRLEDKLKHIESQTSEKNDPLLLLNTLSQEQLAIKLQRSRISSAEKIAKAIENARQKKQNQQFEDYRDVVQSVKGLGEKTIFTIIDEWGRN